MCYKKCDSCAGNGYLNGDFTVNKGCPECDSEGKILIDSELENEMNELVCNADFDA